MRRIKFRIWNNKTKTWIHGPNERADLDGVNLFGETIMFGELLRGVSIEDLNEIEALQFTGLKDVDEKEIFESDIVVATSSDNKYLSQVLWDDKEGRWAFKAIVNKNMPYNYNLTYGCSGWRVVGNVFDNRELLA